MEWLCQRLIKAVELGKNLETIRVFPEFGHPSSLWPSISLVVFETAEAFYLPSQIGVSDELGSKIIAWTDLFHKFFESECTDFRTPPVWKAGIDPYRWYSRGYEIVSELRLEFPHVRVIPQFAQYVFSVNQIREALGKMPIRPPDKKWVGHIDIRDLTN